MSCSGGLMGTTSRHQPSGLGKRVSIGLPLDIANVYFQISFRWSWRCTSWNGHLRGRSRLSQQKQVHISFLRSELIRTISTNWNVLWGLPSSPIFLLYHAVTWGLSVEHVCRYFFSANIFSCSKHTIDFYLTMKSGKSQPAVKGIVWLNHDFSLTLSWLWSQDSQCFCMTSKMTFSWLFHAWTFCMTSTCHFIDFSWHFLDVSLTSSWLWFDFHMTFLKPDLRPQQSKKTIKSWGKSTDYTLTVHWLLLDFLFYWGWGDWWGEQCLEQHK